MFKLLIVDDERLERKSLKIMINDMNDSFIIKEAINGKDAIDIYHKFDPDIILLDIKMPGLNGLQVAEIIKKHNNDKKIIMITAYDDFYMIKNALVLGLNNYLLKPVNQDELKKELKKITNNLNERTNKNISPFSVIKTGIDYIYDHYKEDITLEDIANICSISPCYFSRLFKKELGVNFITYINKMRIDEAKKILINSNETINNISLKMGFDNCGYFIKVFKKIIGVTPKKYRQKFRR
ncbi:response regulator [Clostridium botulinum C]|uniref:response regulator transcription factor n=1 Tax=Clostridium botulinum TaxID=1491 RepID=UPI001E629323|nr:response regulator [Clostridium botulinum]MCD3218097.1 response regulator [Clostridium botulinum C]MCD3244843.1 response regulator [Clostridium botulinum C]MCD3261597.1 response regulator [Clostridium botulinum C]